MDTEERSRDSGPITLSSDNPLIHVDDEDKISNWIEGNGLESKSIDVDLIFLRSGNLGSIGQMGR